MRSFALVVAVVVLASCGARAQEWVKLESGPTLRGETVEETDASVRFIDEAAQVHVIARGDVRRLARKPFSRAVAERLAELGTRDATSLVAIATWARGEKGAERDVSRLALLALAHDPENTEAREILGHVRVFDAWYPDARTAQEAMTERMTADGYVPHLEGWVKAEQAGAIAADPAGFILTENMIWRSYAEVMTERGYRAFEGEWYPREEHDLVDRLATLRQRTKVTAQAARVGACEVFSALGRDSAKEHAENLQKARTWFVATFVGGEGRKPLAHEPVTTVYVFDDPGQLERFADAYGETHGISAEARAFAMRQGHLTWRGLGHALSTRHSAWKNLIVSQLGGDLTKYVWGGGAEVPAFIWVGSAHTAEIEVLASARVQYVAPDRYGQKTDLPAVVGRGIKEVKSLARDMHREKKAPGVRELFHRPFNELQAGDNVYGLALLTWLLAENEKTFGAFMASRETDLAVRVQTAFGCGFEELEGRFVAWLARA